MSGNIKNIVSFRPGVIGNNTAFECMALIYKYLQERHGYSFTIVKSEDDRYEDSNLKVVSIPPKLWKPIPQTPFFWPSLMRRSRIDKLLDHADGVLTVDPTIYPQGLLAIRAAHAVGKPVWFDSSVTLMGMGRTIQWKIAKRVVRPALAKASGIIITVPKCIERFQDQSLFNEQIAGKFCIMGHPVDSAKFRPRPDISGGDGLIRVIVVSRLVPEKGLLYILEAIQPLMRENAGLRLQILGDGPLKPLLEKEFRERELDDRVEFLPTVPHRELPKILATADIFVNHAVSTTGWEEFFGVANLEAMACGLPCVLSNNGGLTHAVRGDDVACLVGERDVIGMRKALRQLVNDPELRCSMGQRARQYVLENYDITVIGEKYRSMLDREIMF
jgi:glycosyltransferase involved in cell wall biosynthesis